ncbi:MAG: DNA methyltransferase, partial [Candidatus Eisenbacteria bacterium]
FKKELDSEAQTKLTAWIRDAASGKLRDSGERNLQGQFFTEVFGRVLGYGQAIGNNHYHMRVEQGAELRGAGRPDGTLGFYEGKDPGQTRVVIELKGPGADLDARQPGYGNITPVEQAFRYVTQFDDCRWVIVSNFETVRLYGKIRGQGYWHEFQLAELEEPSTLRQFLFLLSRESLLLEHKGRSQIDSLAAETHIKEQDITKEFYAFYEAVRGQTFRQLVKDNPAPEGAAQADHEVFLLEKTQKLLDRVLFICFCEDTGLLPPSVIHKALKEAEARLAPTSRWMEMCGLFNAIDKGNKPWDIPGYNGGLFATDAALEALSVADSILNDVLSLSDYDFATDLNVNILGHVFEQSISDLEALRAEIQGEQGKAKGGKRKKEGVFYTPEFITQFIVENTVGSWLAERFEEIRDRHDLDSIDGRKKEERRRAELAMWLEYQGVLRHIKILDPACGSGAFLVAAFDFLMREYQRVNQQVGLLDKVKGPGLFDLDRQILQENLFGVDINPESVEITKLSLWLKTARRDKPLNNLDGNIRCGNSIVSPPGDGATGEAHAAFDALPTDVQRRAFDWRAEFPSIFADGRDGFDCVIGNPPYVRQELLSPIKPYLQRGYRSYHGMADLYVYFYERGVQVLAPGGKLSYIVTNKWLRSGYGEALRGFMATSGVLENIVDFGHAPIFEDADTFPCIIGYRKVAGSESAPTKPSPSEPVVICPMPRDALGTIGVDAYVSQKSYPVPWSRFTSEAWSLENPAVEALMEKIRSNGVPVGDLLGVKPFRGVTTGLNEAFMMDKATKDRILAEDRSAGELLRPYLRGQDLKRWAPDFAEQWMIFSRRGTEIRRFPSVLHHLEQLRTRLEPRPPDVPPARWEGRKPGSYAWFEIQDSMDCWELFAEPKIVIQRICFHPRICLDLDGYFVNDATIFYPTDDSWFLSCMNTPAVWYYMFRSFPHKKDEALSMDSPYVQALPLPRGTSSQRETASLAAPQLVAFARRRQEATRELLYWLRMEFGVEKPSQKLGDFASLDSDGFVQEAKKRMPKGTRLSPSALGELRSTFDEYAVPMRERRAEALQLERRISDLVNEAYGLTPEEIDLMWKTAPPRMPVGR